MEVTILGSGSAIPVPGRFPAGVLIRGAAEVVLVDLGPGVLRRLAETGTGPGEVTAVLFTHYHTDHSADLAALLFALHSPRYRGRPPLRLIGAKGLAELLARLTAAWPWLAAEHYECVVQEIGPGSFELGGLRVQAVAVEHVSTSLGYRISEGPSHVALSGDSDLCEGLVEVARDADLFVCEASFPEAHRTEGHLTPRLAGELAERAGVKKLCLTHFYPECEGHDLLAEARSSYGGEVVLAEDLMRFTVP